LASAAFLPDVGMRSGLPPSAQARRPITNSFVPRDLLAVDDARTVAQ